jgi:hypothetical protein
MLLSTLNHLLEPAVILQRFLPVFATMFLMSGLIDTPAARAADQDNRPAELKVLDRWIGNWVMESTVKSDDLPQAGKVTFNTSIRWTLANRFLQCDAQGVGAQGDTKIKAAFIWICTYDPSAKTYISTSFWSNTGDNIDYWGGGIPATGQWDEKAQTLTAKGTDPANGITTVSVTKWIDADHHEFVRTVTDSAGKVLMEVSGKVRRKG